jgi:hypothetical protein
LQKRSLMFPKKVFYLVPPLKIISVMAIRCWIFRQWHRRRNKRELRKKSRISRKNTAL